MLSFRNCSALLLATLFVGSSQGQSVAPQAYKWSVQYIIDNSQSVFGRSQQVYPRGDRALAISPDGNFLYVGYHQSFNKGAALTNRNSRMTNSGEVRKIDLRVADYEDATKVVLQYRLTKAIAVDDQNRVYLADGATIEVYDGDLNNQLFTIPMVQCEGIATAREGGDTVLYATDRAHGELHRFLIDTRFGSGGAQATPAGLGGNGVMHIGGASSLRGVAVDPKGRIWMADQEAGEVFRVDPNGSNLASAAVKGATAIAFYDGMALVTQGLERQIALVTPDMVVTGNLSVPWEELELAPYGNDHDGMLAGIAAIPGGKGFYVANEHGETANQKSTYGRTDESSEVIGGKLYTDAYDDDNEPILRAVPVEMQAAELSGTAPAAVLPPTAGSP